MTHSFNTDIMNYLYSIYTALLKGIKKKQTVFGLSLNTDRVVNSYYE